MGKKSENPEEKKELTPEEMVAKIAALEAENSDLRSSASDKAEEKSDKPIRFKATVEDEDGKKSAKTFEFTAPAFTWDDNRVYKVKELNKDNAKLFAEVCAKLVQRESGLIKVVEKGE